MLQKLSKISTLVLWKTQCFKILFSTFTKAIFWNEHLYKLSLITFLSIKDNACSTLLSSLLIKFLPYSELHFTKNNVYQC